MPKPNINPNRPIASQAVMNIEKGEEIAGVWVTPNIPGTGCYKLIAKKKKDGACEWAHFVQRDTGLKERVFRGTVENEAALKDVLEIMDANLLKTFGRHIQLKPADTDMYTLDGQKASGTVQ
jgi:hypothetical protein